MRTHAPTHRLTLLFVFVCLAGPSACGTNLNEALYLAAEASGRTALDIFLTDLANTVADSFDQAETPAPDDELGGGTPSPAGPPLEELTGDADVGREFFLSSVCSGCHCTDASGGCALDAPSLAGVATEMLDGRLRGDIEHPGGKFDFTNQNIVDLQAYLASLATGGG